MRISDWSSDVCSSDLPRQQPAQILAFLQPDRAVVNLRDVAHDRESQPGAGLVAVEPRATIEQPGAVLLRDAGAAVLHPELAEARPAAPRREPAAAPVVGGLPARKRVGWETRGT